MSAFAERFPDPQDILKDLDSPSADARQELARDSGRLVDAHLLASALTSSSVLWSIDADLSAAAADLGVGLRRVTVEYD